MDKPRLQEFVARAHGLRRQDDLDAATVAALDAFGSAGIEALLLKGPALARQLYREGERRGYSDIDLLVRPRDLAAARKMLTELGYTKAEEVLGIDDVAGIQHSEVWAKRGEQGDPVCIDLHWRLSQCEAYGDVVWEAFAGSHESIEVRGREVTVPGRDALALHLAVHAAQHGPREEKAIGDLRRGIGRWPLQVWQAAARLAEKVQGVPAFAAGLRLLPGGAELATQLRLPPTPELDWEIAHRDVRPRGTFHLEAIENARGFRERADVLRRSLLPTPQWIRWEFPWARNRSALLIVAYACHILRAPLWALRAMRFLRRARDNRDPDGDCR